MDSNSILHNGRKKPVFSEITTSYEMLMFLQDFDRLGKREDMLFHYCKIEKLNKILAQKEWYFSTPEKMNDRFEYDHFHEWAGKYYLCFMKTSTEEISMWSMYGQPWTEGVRIGIPVYVFKDWIKKTSYVTRTDKNGGEVINNIQCYFGDVLYCHEDPSTDLVLGNNKRNCYYKPYKHEEMAGYIKDIAWAYEKECRFHIDIPYCHDDGVLVHVPDEVISNMTIMTGPRFNMNYDLGENVSLDGITVEQSRFTNKLSWVYCDDCNKLFK